jgi:DNA topoisomerase-3
MFQAEWKAAEGSKYFNTPALYKENGFKEKSTALALIDSLMEPEEEREAIIKSVQKKKEKKNPPLLFNLAEIQNLASKLFRISPEETLKIIQELYEKKLVTYPRTDARVLSTAVAKEIHKNLKGLNGYNQTAHFSNEILENEKYKGLEKTRYVNDKQITDHYAIIPTGYGLGALDSLSSTASKMFEVIVRRFLSIFYPAAEYQKINITVQMKEEFFFAGEKILTGEGYLPVSEFSFSKKKEEDTLAAANLLSLKKGMKLSVRKMELKEGETSPPKRYHSGSMILAMENAGHLIEDEELRAQIKGSGIGTSATRSGILEKLFKISYLNLNKKTQVITPTLKGELVYGIVFCSIPSMLDPTLTASWEKGLEGVAAGNISKEQYMDKLQGFVSKWVSASQNKNETARLNKYMATIAPYYKRDLKKSAEKEEES